jgi:lipopolysaccharide transport system permease protein
MQDSSSASMMTGVHSDLSTESAVTALAVRPRSVDASVRVIRPATFSFSTVVLGLRTLLHYSDLLYTLSVFRLNVRYKQSALGWAWAALQPLALMGIYTFIFAHVTTVKTGGIPYPIFVFSALLPWIFFASAITNSVQGLIAYPNLLTKMYFPREIIPFSYLAAGVIDFLIASVILAFLMVHYRISLTWNVLYGIPILMILVAFAAAMALLFSAVHVRFRDVGLAMPFVLQVWMFATPVVYSLEAVPQRFRFFYLLDPVAGAIDNFRRAVIYGKPPNITEMAWAAAIATVSLAAAYAYFKSSEAIMADII